MNARPYAGHAAPRLRVLVVQPSLQLPEVGIAPAEAFLGGSTVFVPDDGGQWDIVGQESRLRTRARFEAGIRGLVEEVFTGRQ